MNPQPIFNAAYPLIEFKLVIRPETTMRQKLEKLRLKIDASCSLQKTNYTHLHIQLVHFRQFAQFVPQVTERLREGVNSLPPFKIEFRNIDSTTGSSVIVPVAGNNGLTLTLNTLGQYRRLMKAANHSPQFDRSSHIALAQRLSAAQLIAFNKSFTNRSFNSSMLVNSLMLLQRPVGTKAWQIAERFEMLNQPLACRQGYLFA